MPFPRWLARANKHLANRVMIRLADRPPFGALTHIGRTSGRRYRIPVNLFRDGRDVVVALTYGSKSDWVRNVMAAGGATIEFDGRHHTVANPRIVGRREVWGLLPGWVRGVLSLAGVTEFLRLEVEP